MKILREDSLDMERMLQRKLLFGFAWMVYRDDVSVLKPEDLQFFKTQKEAIQYRSANTPNLREIILLEPVATHIKERLNLHAKHHDSKELLPDTIRVDMDMLHVTGYEKERTRERAEDLNNKLIAWGVTANLTNFFEKAIATREPMVLQETRRADKSHIKSALFLEPDREGYYQIPAFTSSLKKYIEIPDLTIGGVNARQIERHMASIDWGSLDPVADLMKDDLSTAKEIAEKAMFVQLKLEQLSLASEGKQVAEKLMAKYWLDTPLEGLIKNADALDKKYIIRQNFDKIGNTLFTQMEAINLMSERYVSKDILEGGTLIQPWYYRHSQSGAASSNIIRVNNSENLDLNKNIEKLIDANIVLPGSRENNIKCLRRGDEVKGEEVGGGYKQEYKVYFNPFLNELEYNKVGHRQKIDLSKDLGKDLGKGPSI